MKLFSFAFNPPDPFSNRAALKPGARTVLIVFALVVLVGFFLFVPTRSANTKSLAAQPPASIPGPSAPQQPPPDFVPNTSLKTTHSTPAMSSRALGASQLVARTASNTAVPGRLPLGSTFKVRLLNTVVSSDSGSPVIAVTTEDVAFGSEVVIPAGTRVLGQCSLDDVSKRLQVRFSAVVFENGDQASISAIALQADGSSGVPGDYSSGKGLQQVGRVGGGFVAGLASGLKDKQPGGWASSPLEPGSLRNGLLNGLSDAASDQARVFSQEMQNVRPYIEVPAGTEFLVYLNQEFTH